MIQNIHKNGQTISNNKEITSIEAVDIIGTNAFHQKDNASGNFYF